MKKIWLASLVLALLAGCSTKTPVYVTPPSPPAKVAVEFKDFSATVAPTVLTTSVVPLSENGYYGSSGVWKGARFDKDAELPRVGFFTAPWMTPSPGPIKVISAGTDLLTTLNAANCGDNIQLQAGATFTINTLNPVISKCDNKHYITLTTSYVKGHWHLPPAGKRVNPSYAGVASLPGRPAFAGGNGVNYMAKIIVTGQQGLSLGAYTHAVGLEVTRPADGKKYSVVVNPNAPYVIWDRNWIHGDPIAETTHLVQIGPLADHVAILDNYIGDAHCTAITGTCTDSQAISASDSGKVIKIVNNFIEAAGENIMFGGSFTLVMTQDIEIRLNHLFKPRIWYKNDPNFIGVQFIVKNLFELKEGERVVFEGNLLDNVWGGYTQKGGGILVTPKNQSGANGSNLCPLCAVNDVTVRYDKVSHAAQGLQVAFDSSDNKGWPLAGSRFSFHDLLFDDMQYTNCNDCAGTTMLIASGYTPLAPPPSVLSAISIDHITLVTSNPPSLAFLNMDGPPKGNVTATPQMSGIKLTNSIFETGINAVYPTGGGVDNCAVGAKTVADKILGCWLNSTFAGNVIVTKALTVKEVWPAGNFIAADWNAVAFKNFNNGIGGDYHLTTAFKNAGTDGKDPGADIDTIMSLVPLVQ